jgi:hypothetical protein
MLKRFYIYVLLSMLFAVTQIGMAAHEISHLNDLTSQSQSDHKHAGNEPCTLCLGLSLIAGVVPSTAFVCPVITSAELVYSANSSSYVQSFDRIYAARAPPSFIQL